jgi:hypothetical protein
VSTRWCGPPPRPGDVIGAVPPRPRPGVVYQCAFCGDAVPSDHVLGHACFRHGWGDLLPLDLDAYDPDEAPYIHYLED